MLFNEYQSELWRAMLDSIEEFRSGKIQYTVLVYGLEGALDEGEFKCKDIVRQWYDYWAPLEIASATQGDNVTIEDIRQDLAAFESFLKSIPFDDYSDTSDPLFR